MEHIDTVPPFSSSFIAKSVFSHCSDTVTSIVYMEQAPLKRYYGKLFTII